MHIHKWITGALTLKPATQREKALNREKPYTGQAYALAGTDGKQLC